MDLGNGGGEFCGIKIFLCPNDSAFWSVEAKTGKVIQICKIEKVGFLGVCSVLANLYKRWYIQKLSTMLLSLYKCTSTMSNLKCFHFKSSYKTYRKKKYNGVHVYFFTFMFVPILRIYF